ncbi:MAG: ATP-binding cassette domain-containing protein [Chloroflexota bacterium]
MSVIATSSLTRRFGDVTALAGLTVELPAGGVIGVVGPNGSGKSTLIRILLGLIRPTSGDASVLGEPITDPTRYAARVGSMIESSAFAGGMSARANLMSLAHLRGVQTSRVDVVLAQVGLLGRDREPVRQFSLGMKQRLGIAMSLLTDPELLILDEPTNGLDPAGIVEVRELLRQLARDGRTVVVSSHLLSELEAICTHVVVIRYGELMFAGPMAQLLERTIAHIDFMPEHDGDAAALADALANAGWQIERRKGAIRALEAAGRAGDLNRAATAAGFTLAHLVEARDSLEDVFLSMTAGETSAAAGVNA